MLRKLMQAAAVIALLTGTASAQIPMKLPLHGVSKHRLTPEEIAKQKALDKAYKSATEKIPDKKPVDPWANIRPNPATAAKNKR
jgi:hypothetical protein